MTYKRDTYVEAEWENGIPEGYVVRTNEYEYYLLDGTFHHSNKNIETATYENRLAQGEAWNESHYYDPKNSYSVNSVFLTKYFAVDGLSVPFEATVNGKTIMAYYVHYGDSKDNEPSYAGEENLNRRFAF